MILALVDGQLTPAERGLVGRCRTCGGICIPRCGLVTIPHWAHVPGGDCPRRKDDPWAEPISQWHIDWQARFPADGREVVIGSHRADVQLAHNGVIIEFQHSSLTGAEIVEREQFYGPRLVWVFDAIDAYRSGRLELHGAPSSIYRTFTWRNSRRTLACTAAAAFLDLGDNKLLRLSQFDRSSILDADEISYTRGGAGTIHTTGQFFDYVNAIQPCKVCATDMDSAESRRIGACTRCRLTTPEGRNLARLQQQRQKQPAA